MNYHKSLCVLIIGILVSCSENDVKFDRKKVCGCAELMFEVAQTLENQKEFDSLKNHKILDNYKIRMIECNKLDDNLTLEQKKELEKVLMDCPASKRFVKNH